MTTRAFVDLFVHNRFRSRWTDSTRRSRTIAPSSVGGGFELDTVTMFCCWALYYLGEIGELSRRVPAMAEAAARGGNRYTAVTLALRVPDRVARAHRARRDRSAPRRRARLVEQLDGSYQFQHLFALASRIDLALYRGRPEDVTARIAADWKPLRRSLVDRPPMQGMLLRFALVRQAVACANKAPPGSTRRREGLAEARKHLRALRGGIPIIDACKSTFGGLISEAEGDLDHAVARYRDAVDKLTRTDTHLFAMPDATGSGGSSAETKARSCAQAFAPLSGGRSPRAGNDASNGIAGSALALTARRVPPASDIARCRDAKCASSRSTTSPIGRGNRPSQLHAGERIRREMWRERSTRDAHQRELVVERDIAAACDRGSLRPELADAWRLGDALRRGPEHRHRLGRLAEANAI